MDAGIENVEVVIPSSSLQGSVSKTLFEVGITYPRSVGFLVAMRIH